MFVCLFVGLIDYDVFMIVIKQLNYFYVLLPYPVLAIVCIREGSLVFRFCIVKI